MSTPSARSRPASTLVALHCSASSPSQWKAYRSLLRPGVELRAPSLIGYDAGTSWSLGSRASLPDEAHHALASLDGDGVDLVGHSYGGAVALQIATLWPERVRSVTVYEPVAFHLLEADASSRPQAAEIRTLAEDVENHVWSGDHEAAAERFIDYWAAPGAWSRVPLERRAAFSRCMPKVCAEFAAALGADPGGPELPANGPAVSIVVGTASPAPVRRVADLLFERLPHAIMIRVPGASHMAPVTQPALLAPVLFGDSLAA
jgi:pimeloyl-ACP methyl ester carboxylesterase